MSPVTRIGDVADAVRGITFQASQASFAPVPNSVACLTTSAVYEDLRWSTARYIPRALVRDSGQILSRGDILVSTANSKSLVGKSALVRSVPFEATFGAFVTVLRPKPGVDPEYLALWMRTPEYLGKASRLASQTTNIANLSIRDLLDMELPYVALSHQRGVAIRLGKQLAAVRSANEIASARFRTTTALRDTVLRTSFDSVEASRWRRMRLDELSEFISDGTHQPPTFATHGVPFLFVRNIVGGQIDFNTSKHISVETYEELTRRRRPSRGDVLYSAVGSFGVAVVVESDRPFTFQRHIAHLRLRTDLADPVFLAAYINSPAGRRQSQSAAMGGAQRTVTLGALASFGIPIPPVEVQRLVAAELCHELAAIDAIETSIRAEKEAIDALPSALLSRAFGELAA